MIAERGPRGDLTPRPQHRDSIALERQESLPALHLQVRTALLETEPVNHDRNQPALGLGCCGSVHRQRIFRTSNATGEFQVSPHGEWVDLDIDRNPNPPNHNLQWNSGYEVKARINEKEKVWYGEMRIPIEHDRHTKTASRSGFANQFFPLPGAAARPQTHRVATDERRQFPRARSVRPSANGEIAPSAWRPPDLFKSFPPQPDPEKVVLFVTKMLQNSKSFF